MTGGGARPCEQPQGVALVLSVFLAMAMFGVGHGLLLGAQAATIASRALSRSAAVEAEAEGVVAGTLRKGWGSPMDTVPIGGHGEGVDTLRTGAVTRTIWRRLAAEIWLLEISLRSLDGWQATSRRLIWGMNPETRIDALGAALSVGSDGEVKVAGDFIVGAESPLAVVEEVALGRLSLEEALKVVMLVEGSGTPRPLSSGGECLTGVVWNWGDQRADAPCSDFAAVRGSRGSLIVDGGVGQGLVLVDGDLTLRGTHQFRGLLLVSGMLRLDGGAIVEGMALALGGVEIGPGSRFVASREIARWSLEETRSVLSTLEVFHPAQRLGPT
jgi:hypothetical protein